MNKQGEHSKTSHFLHHLYAVSFLQIVGNNRLALDSLEELLRRHANILHKLRNPSLKYNKGNLEGLT